MRKGSPKVVWGRALGAYLGQDRIVLTEVARTLTGMVVLSERRQEVNGSTPGAVLKRWLEKNLTARQRRAIPICVGVGAEQAFFTTRFLDPEQRKGPLSAGALLESSGAFQAWNKDTAAADYIETKLPGGAGYSLAAVKRGVAEDVFSNLRAANARRFRLEPAPWALSMAADRQARPPKSWKLAVRVLLGKTDGIAMLVVDGQAVLWRRFALGETRRALSVTSAIRALQIYARQSFDVQSLDGVLLEGRVDDQLAKGVAEATGLDVAAAPGAEPMDSRYSLALALSAHDRREGTLDLMRSLRPPPSIREIFPWKLAGLVLFLGACMTLLLWNKSVSLGSQCARLERQSTSRAWAGALSTPAINEQRNVLAGEVGAVRKFVATRIVWSDYLRDLPTRLPTNACLSDIQAVCELPETDKKKQKGQASKCMTLRAMARYGDRSEAPRDIDAFLNSLCDMEILKRDFPVVQLADIKWRKEGRSEIAMFTILAMPGKNKQAD